MTGLTTAERTIGPPEASGSGNLDPTDSSTGEKHLRPHYAAADLAKIFLDLKVQLK